MDFGLKVWVDGSPTTENKTLNTDFKDWASGSINTQEARVPPLVYEALVMYATESDMIVPTYSFGVPTPPEPPTPVPFADTLGTEVFIDGTPTTENWTLTTDFKAWAFGSIFIQQTIDLAAVAVPNMVADNAEVVVPVVALVTKIVPNMVADSAEAVVPTLSFLYATPLMIADNAEAVVPVITTVTRGIKVQVYDITNDSYFDITPQSNVGNPYPEPVTDYYTFVVTDSWLNSRESFSFDPASHPTCTELAIKFTNMYTGDVYLDGVMMTPDFTGKWPQLYKDGPHSSVATVVDQRTGSELFFWTGSQAQYDALEPNADTLYFITS